MLAFVGLMPIWPLDFLGSSCLINGLIKINIWIGVEIGWYESLIEDKPINRTSGVCVPNQLIFSLGIGPSRLGMHPFWDALDCELALAVALPASIVCFYSVAKAHRVESKGFFFHIRTFIN